MAERKKPDYEGYIHTLDICYRELPAEANIIHRERLTEIRNHFRLLQRIQRVQDRNN